MPLFRTGLAAVGLVLVFAVVARSELTKENRAEIAAVTKSIGEVSGHVRKKEFDEADKIIKDAEEKLTAIATAAAVKEDDKAFTPARVALQKAKTNLQLAKDKASGKKPEKPKPVSFALDVARSFRPVAWAAMDRTTPARICDWIRLPSGGGVGAAVRWSPPGIPSAV